MAKTLYDYWFVQFDFPNEQGKPYKSSGGKMVWNEELKREIPEGWEVKKLAEIANLTMGQSPEGSSYNDEGIGEIFFQGSTDFGWRYPTIRQFTTEPSRRAKAGDILLSVRAPVGTLNIADNDCCIGRGLAALNSKSGYDSYLFYVMQYFKQIFDYRNNAGTTFGAITKDDLFSLKLVYPKDDQLKKYNHLVAKYNQMILNNYKQNQQLSELRDWLLPMLMNGQVRVGGEY
jgi:type I restriction enzyme S subunit